MRDSATITPQPLGSHLPADRHPPHHRSASHRTPDQHPNDRHPTVQHADNQHANDQHADDQYADDQYAPNDRYLTDYHPTTRLAMPGISDPTWANTSLSQPINTTANVR